MKMKKLMSGLLAFAMAASMLTIPAFAAITASLSAPAITTDYTIDYAKEELTFVEATQGVALFVGSASATAPTSASDETVAGWTSANFANVPTATPLSLTPGTNLKAYLVTTADPTVGTTAVTDYSATAGTITVPARPGTPATNLFTVVNNTNGTTDGTIKLTTGTESDYETSIDSGSNWAALTSSGVTGLAKDATVDIRLKAVTTGGSEAFASAAVTLTMDEGAAKTPLTAAMFEMTTPKVAYKGAAYDSTANAVKLTSAGTAASITLASDVDITFPTEATNVGTKTVTIAAKSTGNFQGSVTVKFEIEPVVITDVDLAGATITKAYDGTKNITWTTGIVAKQGSAAALPNSEDLAVTVTGTVPSADVAPSQDITFTAISFANGTAGKVANYSIDNAKMLTKLKAITNKTAAITPKTITPTPVPVISTTSTAVVATGTVITLAPIMDGGKTLTVGADKDYTVAWTVGGAARATANNKMSYTVVAGDTGKVKATVTLRGNYVAANPASNEITIGSKALPKPILKSGSVVNPASKNLVIGDYTIEVPGLKFTDDYTVSAAIASGATTTDGTLAVVAGNVDKAVTVTITGAGDYASNTSVETYKVAALPTAPTGVIVRSATGTLNLTLTGQTNGGAPITKIEYTIYDGTTTTNNVFADVVGERSVTIKNLENGKAYTISAIKTQNAMGLSASAYGSSVTGTPQRTTSGSGSTGSSGSSGSSSGTTTIEPSLPANATATSVKVGADVPAEVTNVPSTATIVADTKPITTEIAKRAEGFGIKQVLNIDLKDGTTKITAIEGGKVKVTLPFAGVTGKQYVALRFNNDGTTSVIPATYVDGNITFNTNHFSLYAIAEVGGKTVVNGTTTGGTTTGKVPQTGIVALAPLF